VSEFEAAQRSRPFLADTGGPQPKRLGRSDASRHMPTPISGPTSWHRGEEFIARA